MEEELKVLLQNVGDGIADMFEQLIKGSWEDSMGHAVKDNAQMLALQGRLMEIAAFRAKWLGYSPL